MVQLGTLPVGQAIKVGGEILVVTSYYNGRFRLCVNPISGFIHNISEKVEVEVTKIDFFQC